MLLIDEAEVARHEKKSSLGVFDAAGMVRASIVCRSKDFLLAAACMSNLLYQESPSKMDPPTVALASA